MEGEDGVIDGGRWGVMRWTWDPAVKKYLFVGGWRESSPAKIRGFILPRYHRKWDCIWLPRRHSYVECVVCANA